MRDWCVYAMSEYEKWRMMEIDKALKEKRPLPPLCETSYPLLVEWAQKMKDLSGRVIQNGAFNAESSQLSSQLKSFTPTSSPEKDLNMGETNRCRRFISNGCYSCHYIGSHISFASDIKSTKKDGRHGIE